MADSRWMLAGLAAVLALAMSGAVVWPPRLKTAPLGDFPLQSGERIHDAFITYRTSGRLNRSRSNAVLVLPWFQGTSWDLAFQIGPDRLVDTRRYFVIMADAFGNGVSSSPSNAGAQPGDRFPEISIADMVESQYRLVTETLGLTRLHAVVGISMGGMQVFQWATAHPTFMSKAISIVGSPQAQRDDRQRWQEAEEAVRVPASIRVRRAGSTWQPRSVVQELRLDADNYISQSRAIRSFDLPAIYGGSLARAAQAIHADLFVVSTWADQVVNPAPAFALAKAANASILELDARCGHQAPSCERATLWPEVDRFLARTTP